MLQLIGWILLSVLGLLLIILLLPIHVRARYDGNVQAWCGLGPVTLRVFPFPKKERDPAREKPKKKPKKDPKAPKVKKKMPSGDQICDYIHLGAEALGTLKRKLLVKNLVVHLKISGTDAAATALNYGRATAAVSAVYPVLENNLRIRKSDIAVDADFEGTKSSVLADLTISACMLRLLLAAGVLFLHFRSIQSKYQSTEPITEKEGGNRNE